MKSKSPSTYTRASIPPGPYSYVNVLNRCAPFFIEDPIRSENPQSFANLRHHTSAPIATGEQLLTKWQFRGAYRERVD